MNDIFAGEKTVHIYSTLTNAQQYPVYRKSPQGDNVVEAYVHINGGSGLANKHLITPVGVLTSVSERAYEHLKESSIFQAHVEAGYITVRDKQVDIERAVADHSSERDNSAPLTPEDYTGVDAEDDAVAVPITAGAEKGKGRRVITKRG